MVKKDNNKDHKRILKNNNTRNSDSKSKQENVENSTRKEGSEFMHDYDLRSFLSNLEKRGELITIHKKVKKKFELAAIISKFDKKEAVMFTNVDESKFKVVSNILGTRERFFYDIESSIPNSRIDLSNLGNIGSEYYPKEYSNEAPFYNNSTRNLYDLPIVSHFEKDAGPFITSSTVYVKDQENGNQNSSVHRMLL
ncbi:MAG: UbiD family decarboxylase, partial [Thermoproteota archaeon]|nr:UbiD family decarboxylase [Thermoproteota archaeon]